MTDSLDPGLIVIRTTLEATLTAPFSVAVTSASTDDGKTGTAVGIARAFAESGYRTAIVDANPDSPDVGRTLGVGSLGTPRSLEAAAHLRVTSAAPNLDAASIADAGLLQATSSSALRAFVAELRGLYAVTVWDTGSLFGDALSIQCATACDGVLVAVRHGRRVLPDDARVVATLEQVGANVLGIVLTGYDTNGTNGRNGHARTLTKTSDHVRPSFELPKVRG
jgi:receptor protein-tyrosine kinase